MDHTSYTRLLIKYNGAVSGDGKEVVSIPLHDERQMKYAVFKARSLLENVWMDCLDKRPLVRSLQIFFKIQMRVTVFHGHVNTLSKTWAMLLGNRMIIYPQSSGNTSLILTSYFVKDSNLRSFQNYVTTDKTLKALKATSSAYDNVYLIDNTILFLDPYQVPYPGGCYFDEFQPPSKWYRVCFLGRKEDGRHGELTSLISRQKYLVVHTFNKCRPRKTHVSRLIRQPAEPYTLKSLGIRDENFKKSGVVQKTKCLQVPTFLLQDVVDSHGQDRGEIGVVLETPITISHDYDPGEIYVNDSRTVVGHRASDFSGNGRSFVAYAVNCALPRTMLFVPKPYDRYYEYMNVPKEISSWTTVLYDSTHEDVPFTNPVIFDGNVVGYWYRDRVFLGLSDVRLPTHVTVPRFRNVDKMFIPALESDVTNDPHLTILDRYEWDESTVLFRLKHQQVRNQVWCVSQRIAVDGSEKSLEYVRKPRLSPLVSEWMELLVATRSSFGRFPHDPHMIKLLYVLTKHDVCLSLRSRPEDQEDDIVMEDNRIVFRVDKSVCSFVNGLRFDCEEETGGDEEKGASSSCSMS